MGRCPCACVQMCAHACLLVCACVCACACVHVCVRACVCARKRLCVCMCTGTRLHAESKKQLSIKKCSKNAPTKAAKMWWCKEAVLGIQKHLRASPYPVAQQRVMCVCCNRYSGAKAKAKACCVWQQILRIGGQK